MSKSICNPRIALVGCGKMGHAILTGWLASDADAACALVADNFTVVEPTPERAELLEREYGVAVVENAAKISSADIVLLAVKPQIMDAVIAELPPSLVNGEADPLFVSIAAGVPTSKLEDMLFPGVRVVRVMPNMPLQVGMGATVVAGGKNATTQDVEQVRDLFAALGFASVVDEDAIDAICAISGGGPAYVAHMIEALRDAGVAQGLDATLAERLAVETVGGTYSCLVETNVTPEDLRISVCSPGGTTLAALAAMDSAGFSDSIAQGVQGAIDRAKELA